MNIPRCLEWAHNITEKVMTQGPGLAIDATVGNGKDTLHLARVSGPDGMVWGFDIQDEAIENTRSLLTEKCLEKHVTLIKACHTDMKKLIPDEYREKISAIMFNLGYLPTSDHSIITKAETTIPALETALEMLRVGGIVTVVIYPGHENSEAKDVVAWAEKLDQKRVEALWYRFVTHSANAPSLLCLERRS